MLRVRIRELRQERGWTLAELADKAGLSLSYLAEIETHRKTINSRRLEQIARVFGCNPQDLEPLTKPGFERWRG